MRIAIVSDIHDNVWNLSKALTIAAECERMVCCGDLCSPFVIDQLARGFSGEIHIVTGNNDADMFRITSKAAMKYSATIRLRGEFFEAEWDRRLIAAQHFDNIALAIAESGRYDAVFYGHNHAFDVRRIGRTLAVNPGSVMGAQFDSEGRRVDVIPTMAVYDTSTGEAERLEIL
jgi:putative phosphoesterase